MLRYRQPALCAHRIRHAGRPLIIWSLPELLPTRKFIGFDEVDALSCRLVPGWWVNPDDPAAISSSRGFCPRCFSCWRCQHSCCCCSQGHLHHRHRNGQRRRLDLTVSFSIAISGKSIRHTYQRCDRVRLHSEASAQSPKPLLFSLLIAADPGTSLRTNWENYSTHFHGCENIRISAYCCLSALEAQETKVHRHLWNPLRIIYREHDMDSEISASSCH